MNEFRPMPKVPRLSREIVVTEKIDGTNASVFVQPWAEFSLFPHDKVATVGELVISAGSRTRWITPEDDNYGFARWARDNAEELAKLGPGHHFGEWWGRGINRGYDLAERRFSLFNVGRWYSRKVGAPVRSVAVEMAPACCDVVPILARESAMDTAIIEVVLRNLARYGSAAAPGFMDPEGVMVYHSAANQLFKKTIRGDEEGKHAEAHPRKERPPRPPKDPSKGGRRKGGGYYEGPYRRKTDVL